MQAINSSTVVEQNGCIFLGYKKQVSIYIAPPIKLILSKQTLLYLLSTRVQHSESVICTKNCIYPTFIFKNQYILQGSSVKSRFTCVGI